MKLVWTTIKVKNIDRSIKFYSDLLGLPVDREFVSDERKFAMLGKVDDTKIELMEDPNLIWEHGTESFSLGLECDNLEETIGKIRAARLALLGPIAPNPSISFYYLTDPDGYTVQLCKRTESF